MTALAECPFQTICPDCMEYLCKDCKTDSLELDAEYFFIKNDHVSKKALREFCEAEIKRCKKDVSFSGLGEATGYQEVINRFCKEEK